MADIRQLYEAASPDGPEHWVTFVAKMTEMFRREPHIPLSDVARVASPTLVLAADDDLCTFEHTIALHKAIANSQLAIVPGASHALVWEKPASVSRLVLDFLGSDSPVATILPMRRAIGAAAGG